MSLLTVMAGVSIFVVLFALQNAQTVALNFIFIEFQGSLAFVTLTAFFCGLLVAGCYLLIYKAKQYIKDKANKEEIEKLTQEKQKQEELIQYLKEHNGQMPEVPKVRKVKNPFIHEWKD